MSKQHLLSTSLYNTLFQHNIISRDGYVKATDEQIKMFREFLVQQARDNTTELYKKRKEMVDEVTKLLREDELSPKEKIRLALLLRQLNLKMSSEGLLEDDKPPARQPTYQGASEPNKSKCDRQMLAEEKRLKVLRRDLEKLDEWLEEVNSPYIPVKKHPTKTPADSKADETRFRARTARRNLEMEMARHRLISTYHAENTKSIKHTLAKKDQPGRVRFKRVAGSSTGGDKESVESFATAASQFSDTRHGVSRKGKNFTKNKSKPQDEEESGLKVKKSKATEKINVHPGVQVPIDEETKLRPTEGVTTYVSEPIMGAPKESSGTSTKQKKEYHSESSLDDKARKIAPILDGTEQCIVTSEDGGIDTNFFVKDGGSGSSENLKKLNSDKMPSDNDNKHKSVLKASRKRINKVPTSGIKKFENIAPRDNKQEPKNPSKEHKDQKYRPLSKYASAEDGKARKPANITSLERKRVPEISQKETKLKSTDNKAKIADQRNIIDSKYNNKETGRILKTNDSVDKTKNHIRPQVNKKPNRPQGKEEKKSDEKLHHKNVLPKIQPKENHILMKKQSNLVENFEGTLSDTKNQPKIIDYMRINAEKGKILKKKDSIDKTNHRTRTQVDKRPNLPRGKMDDKNHEKLHDKKALPKKQPKENDLSLKKQSSLVKDFESAQRSSPNKDGFVENKNKTAEDNQEMSNDSEYTDKKKDDQKVKSKKNEFVKDKNKTTVDKQGNNFDNNKKSMFVDRTKAENDIEKQFKSKEDVVAENTNNVEDQPELKDADQQNKNDDKTVNDHFEVKSKKDGFIEDKNKTKTENQVNNFDNQENSIHVGTSDNDDIKEQFKSNEDVDKNKNDNENYMEEQSELKDNVAGNKSDIKNNVVEQPEIKDKITQNKNDNENNVEGQPELKANAAQNKSDNENYVEEEHELKDNAAGNKSDSENNIVEKPEMKDNASLNKNDNESNIKEQSGIKDNVSQNKNGNESNIQEQPESNDNVTQNKSDSENNSKEQSELKDNVAQNKNDGIVITGRPVLKSKESDIHKKVQHLSLEEDFLQSQRDELVRDQPKSESTEKLAYNAGSVENGKGNDEKNKQSETNSNSEKSTTEKSQNNPTEAQSNNETEHSKDNEDLTLDQTLSMESEINAKKNKDRQNRNSNVVISQNHAKNNIENPVGISSSPENAKSQNNPAETQSNNETENSKFNEELTLDQTLSMESEINTKKSKERQNSNSNKSVSQNLAKKNLKTL